MSLLRNLATSLINAQDERIITTLPKAKELRPFVERAITLSRHATNLEGDDRDVQAVHLRRQAATFFHSGNRQQKVSTGKRGQERAPRTAGVLALRRLFDELGERFKDRPGGYTRIIKLGHRDGDNAELAIIELVDNRREREAIENAKKRAKAATTGKKKTAKASKEVDETSSRRGGKKADKTYEKEETTKARGRGVVPSDEQTEDQQPKGGRRAKKTETTANEKDTK
ncbi:MAG: large subunit ribosomal protein [Acidobacteriota bacterium]|jgi:large subunit ribosomal protein L17|nr:large subunit ribosomal protein [Acidobacteriota bacterium]